MDLGRNMSDRPAGEVVMVTRGRSPLVGCTLPDGNGRHGSGSTAALPFPGCSPPTLAGRRFAAPVAVAVAISPIPIMRWSSSSAHPARVNGDWPLRRAGSSAWPPPPMVVLVLTRASGADDPTSYPPPGSCRSRSSDAAGSARSGGTTRTGRTGSAARVDGEGRPVRTRGVGRRRPVLSANPKNLVLAIGPEHHRTGGSGGGSDGRRGVQSSSAR